MNSAEKELATIMLINVVSCATPTQIFLSHFQFGLSPTELLSTSQVTDRERLLGGVVKLKYKNPHHRPLWATFLETTTLPVRYILFCRFRKRVGALQPQQKTNIFLPSEVLNIPVTVKRRCQNWPIIHSLLFGIYILLTLFLSSMQLKYC